MPKINVVIVSVVRDFDMYRNCILRNSNMSESILKCFDNRENNENIPVLYNRFLDSFNYEKSAWIMFCHEDFELQEPIGKMLASVDKASIYGPIGGKLRSKRRWLLGGVWYGELKGTILESAKDGSELIRVGNGSATGTIIDALDCQCVIVHSDLVRKYHLRFDEKLSFDLYAEDFCLGAYVNHHVLTRIISLKCHHHSHSKPLQRFFAQKAYLDAKYPTVEIQSTVGYTIGGGRTTLRRFQKRVRNVMDKRWPWLASLIIKLLG